MIVGEVSQTELHSYLDLRNIDRVQASRSTAQNMRSLCLTSKRVESIARPLLFRTITVSSPAQLLLLYVALQENTQLGLHIRQIGLEILLKNVEPNDLMPLPSGAGKLLSTGWEKPARELSREENVAYYCDHLLSSAYFEVLHRAPNTHRLVLRIQGVQFCYAGERERQLTFAYEPFFRKVQRVRTSGSVFLPRLKTLQVLGDPEQPGKMVLYDICAPLFRNTTLETIKISQVVGLFDDLSGPGCNIWKRHESGLSSPSSLVSPLLTSASDSAFKTVKVAEIRDFLCIDREFRGFGDLLPNLESLKLSLMMDDFYNCSGPDGTCKRGQNRFEDIQACLKKMKNLKTLSLELSHSCKIIDMTKLPARGLNLASLVNLETVRMPLLILAGGDEDTTIGESIKSRLAGSLPRYLKRLTVTVEVSCLARWHGDGTTKVYRPTSTPTSTLLDFMEAILSLGAGSFPHLEEVVCCYSMKGYRRREELEIADTGSTDLEEAGLFDLEDDGFQRFKELRRSVRLQGVRLGVAYEQLCAHIQSRDTSVWA
ncbi:hypothetical protein DHEL01_v208503 [Diaporthe helianthi]|uniref:Uncharacterized protein n=1 Tax=Diaporthe helianthi TaxID=158607 RepID=A0A2P5HS89_DIAHE|nr:hypothetical protein DHEL01_v208503 [Diaporthe helianthi]